MIARSLSDLLRNLQPFVFDDLKHAAFNELKSCLTRKPVLKIYVQEAETELHTDASRLGAVLMQRDSEDGQWHPVYFMPVKTSEVEERYDAYTLEVLAIVKAVTIFRVYLLDKEFKIVTDCQAFQKTVEKKDVVPRIVRWVMYLQDSEHTVEHRRRRRAKPCFRYVDVIRRKSARSDTTAPK